MSEQITTANGIAIAYQEFQTSNTQQKQQTILLINGVGDQMIAWPDAFCQGLADANYQVIRFDNRDVGLSQKIDDAPKISIPKALLQRRLGMQVTAGYTLHDLANDATGLLDALRIEAAHIVGMSMGGMVAQIIASEQPNRVLSLTSLMSSSGNPKMSKTDKRVSKNMLSGPNNPSNEQRILHKLENLTLIASPAYPIDQTALRTRIEREMQRCYYPKGYLRQFIAIIENGDRRPLLKKITARSLVIHGKNDILLPPDNGIDTAKNIAGAKLVLIDGMGHDICPPLYERLISEITQHASDT